MRATYMNALKKILVLLMLATVAFIFIQSSMSPEKSAEQSDKVGEIVEEIIPPDTTAGEFVKLNLRKIAHFVEFALLGLEISAYVCLFARRKNVILASYPLALFIAFFDETIQIFSGRGSSVKDVWLDFLGFSTASAIVYIAVFSVLFVSKRMSEGKSVRQ